MNIKQVLKHFSLQSIKEIQAKLNLRVRVSGKLNNPNCRFICRYAVFSILDRTHLLLVHR